ncbi:uncharacterized protein LOC121729031 isoform X2 [Aricia agestis]|uniref:uncharacterized protein LOC121729031 isoform X2 n=1 Tax=Aricia agestis TaxID=91739 RepID=UPI001C20BBA5|nr:uncharacterized protein LOC121729031 isoform X2 [Aricia agestis]
MLSVLVCLACVLVSSTQPQPLCSDVVHCPEGSYCDTEAHLCTKCLVCEEHRRKPPEAATACIRSITECGPCVEEGDVSPECMGTAAGGATPAYVWGAVFVALLLLALIVFIVVYAVRNLGDFKIRAFASASVQQPQQFAASAPQELPPPYAPRPWDDYAPDSQPSSGTYVPQDDSIHPFISRDTKGRATGARESDDNQAARPYGYPSYVRPPSYEHEESPARDLTETPTFSYSEDLRDSTDIRDSRDTRDSNGNAIPVTSVGVAGGSAAGDALALPADRRRHQFQDRNNNGGGSCASPAHAPPPPALVINVMQTINALQQQNNVNTRPVSP